MRGSSRGASGRFGSVTLGRVPLISEDSVRAVKDAADLVELVRGRVELVRRGGRWWAPCPFHQETAPSFCLIPPDNRTYYCHGCRRSGDAISWMLEMEGAAGFSEAIEALAERFGVELVYERTSPEDDARRESARRREELLERAAVFYLEYLWRSDEAAPAREYLGGRGFDEDLLRRYRIGYAPRASTLSARALQQGFSREQLLEAGLARARGGTAQDFFAARIMFPIANQRGKVQGFGARTLDPIERAKYVNSPEGPLFQKRRLLFGLQQAREEAAHSGWIAVVEGYTDVMGLAVAGRPGAVACMGTALTVDQLRILSRWAKEVRVCFDADRAGEEAAWRTALAAREVPALGVSAVRLPAGRDPGDLAADDAGRAELRRLIDDAEPLVTSLIRARAARAGRSPRDRDQALADISDLLRGVDDSVEKDEAVRVATSELGLSRSTEERLREATRHETVNREGPPTVVSSPQRALEERLLTLATAAPELAAPHLDDLSAGAFTEPDHARAFSLLTGGTPVGEWPEELAPLSARIRALASESTATQEEIREAAYRLQLPLLERRAAKLREQGAERELLEVLELRTKLRTALRGEE
jgi:DNA primase